MQHLPGKRVLALVFGLGIAAVGSASAQDTTETGRATLDTIAPEAGAIDTSGVDTSATRDSTDSSSVQNPPGYRGLERDTTAFPDSGGTAASPGAVEDHPSGTHHDSSHEAGAYRIDPSGSAKSESVPPTAADTLRPAPDSTQ